MLFDVHTLQVRHEYQSFGMPIPHLYNEPEDHLGLEFRFITHLCQLGLGALDQNQPDILDAVTGEIRSFLSEHLLKWASPCLGLVIENAKSDYYRGCAHLALGCLAHTNETMELEAAR
jgi:TorA maturation chaperone TorD